MRRSRAREGRALGKFALLRGPALRDGIAAGFGGTLGTVGANAAIQASGLLASVIVARGLGASVRGEYAGAAAWCAMLSALADLGVAQAVAYRTASGDEASAGTIGTGLLFAGGLGLAGALVGLLATGLLLAPNNPPLALATALFLPSIPIVLMATHASLAAQGLGLVATFNAIRVGIGGATLAGVALVLVFGLRSSAALMGAIVGFQALATGLSLWLLRRRTSGALWRFDRGEAGWLLRFGVRTHLGNLAWLANGKLDQMVMSVMLPSRDLGHYSIAVSYAGIAFSLANATTDAGFARLAAELSPEERRARLAGALRRIGGLSLGLGVGLALLAPFALPLVFGGEFRPSVLPAVLLLLGSVVLGLNYTMSVGLRASGRPLLTSVGEGAGLLVTGAGLLFALRYGGIVGASVLSLASYGATFACLAFLVRRHLGGVWRR